MGCQSDYLDVTDKEKAIKQTAKLLVYTMEELGRPVEAWMRADADSVYPTSDRSVIKLCEVLNDIGEDKRDNLIYLNARDPRARRLADWWESHSDADLHRLLPLLLGTEPEQDTKRDSTWRYNLGAMGVVLLIRGRDQWHTQWTLAGNRTILELRRPDFKVAIHDTEIFINNLGEAYYAMGWRPTNKTLAELPV